MQLLALILFWIVIIEIFVLLTGFLVVTVYRWYKTWRQGSKKL